MTADRPPAATQLRRSWGVRLLDRRRELGLTQAAVATAAGIGQPTLSRIERGVDTALTAELMLRLAVVLKADPGILYAWPPALLAQAADELLLDEAAAA